MSEVNFPFPWWNKKLTIYNKVVDSTTQRASWVSTVLENCFWKNVNGTYYAGKMKFETKDIICRIPKSEKFVSKRVWDTLTSEQREGHFTLANGDIIILGEVEDVIDEYTSGKRSTDIVEKYKKYDECLQIDKYVDNTGDGMALEHYRIIGL